MCALISPPPTPSQDIVHQLSIIYLNLYLFILLSFYMKYFSEENLVTLAYEIVKGLAYLNKRGITHRNLSQENILFNKKVHVFVVHEHVIDVFL